MFKNEYQGVSKYYVSMFCSILAWTPLQSALLLQTKTPPPPNLQT